MSASGARNFLMLVSGGSSLARAFSFMARFASTYRWVVFMLSCPSYRAMTLKGTPDCRRCMAVVCRNVCGETAFLRRLGSFAAALATAK